jgi:hypothetical protein
LTSIPDDDFTSYDSDPAYAKSKPVTPLTEKWLWKTYLGDPISNLHPRKAAITALPYKTGYWNSSVPFDLLPQQPLLFAKNTQELRWISRISACVLEGGTVSTPGTSPGIRKYYDLCGFRVEYTTRAWEPKRYMGITRKLNEKGEGDWAEEDMNHFEIDGPGGEFITEIEVGMNELPKALKVCVSVTRLSRWSS